ncbi:MAG: cupin domain-containing protein [Hyphomicrobiales bacterium]
MSSYSANEVIGLLGLAPHPEGGWYRETFRDPRLVEMDRPASTAIYFLLKAGEISHWHSVDAAEVWLFHAGAPLALSISTDGSTIVTHRLGGDLAAGERPQAVVPASAWQSAKSLGEKSLGEKSLGEKALGEKISGNVSTGDRSLVRRSSGDWTLVTCTVAPGFEFAGFKMAPPGWRPSPRKPGLD